MTTTTTINFSELTSVCKNIASELHTMVEVQDYSEYGWAAIAFMTDKFGGTYVNLHYDHKSGKVTNWYGTKNAREIENIEQLKMMVKYYMKRELKARDMEALSEFINSQY
jgi:hypothetical protein